MYMFEQVVCIVLASRVSVQFKAADLSWCRYTIVALAAIHFTYCIASYIHFHTQLSFTRGTHFNAQRLTFIS